MEKDMNAFTKGLLSALVLSFPILASAQSNDAMYCSALSDRYSQYLNMNSKRGAQPQSLDAQVAVEKCKAGDTAASIPVLEKALKDAKLDLPPRT
jgi:hypothetical protein